MRAIIKRNILIASTAFVILVICFLSLTCISEAFATDSYLLYVHNRDRSNYYYVRITNENSRRKDSLTVDPASCNIFAPTDEEEYSVRVYRKGTAFTDHAIIEIDHTSCIELNSVTGKVSLCNRNFCLD
jgi:hypothetical protein